MKIGLHGSAPAPGLRSSTPGSPGIIIALHDLLHFRSQQGAAQGFRAARPPHGPNSAYAANARVSDITERRPTSARLSCGLVHCGQRPGGRGVDALVPVIPSDAIPG